MYDTNGFFIPPELHQWYASRRSEETRDAAELRAERPQSWERCIPVKVPGRYAALGNAIGELDEAVREQISKDIPRTFPDHASFRSETTTHQDERLTVLMRETTQRVLERYALFEQDIGYCQGMNYLVAFILLGLGLPAELGKDGGEGTDIGEGIADARLEECAFWALDMLIREVMVDYFSPSLLGVHVDQRVLQALLHTHCPRVADAVKSNGILLPMLCTRWMMCGFAMDLPSETALRLWDSVVGQASPLPVFQLALALFERHAASLLNCKDPQDAMLILREAPKYALDAEHILAAAQNIPLKSETLKQLRRVAHSTVSSEMRATQMRRDVQVLSGITTFSKEELVRLQGRFYHLSEDDRKGIDLATFEEVMREAAPEWSQQPEVVKRLFEVVDMDANGTVEFSELAKGLSLLTRGSLEDKLRVVFKAFDSDNSGKIDRQELELMLGGLFTNDDATIPLADFVDNLIRTLDEDGDGLIDFEEFTNIVKYHPKLISLFFLPEPDVVATPASPEEVAAEAVASGSRRPRRVSDIAV